MTKIAEGLNVLSLQILRVLRNAGVDPYPGFNTVADHLSNGGITVSSGTDDSLILAEEVEVTSCSVEDDTMTLGVTFNEVRGENNDELVKVHKSIPVPRAAAAAVAGNLLAKLVVGIISEENMVEDGPQGFKTLEVVHQIVLRTNLSDLLSFVTSDVKAYVTYLETVQTSLEKYNKRFLSSQARAAILERRRLEWLATSGLSFEMDPFKGKHQVTTDLSQVSRENLVLNFVFRTGSDKDTMDMLAKVHGLDPDFQLDRLWELSVVDVVNMSDDDLVKDVSLLLDSPYEWVENGRSREMRRRRVIALPFGTKLPKSMHGATVDPATLEGMDLLLWLNENWRSLPAGVAATSMMRLPQHQRISLLRQGVEHQDFWFDVIKSTDVVPSEV